VCVCVRERERGGEREIVKPRQCLRGAVRLCREKVI
jgi:hypothetical protein